MVMSDSATTVSPDTREPDQWVSTGRESLDSWWGTYPWYDRTTDEVRAIHVPPKSHPETAVPEASGSSNLLPALGYTVLGILAGALLYMVYRYVMRQKGGVSKTEDPTAVPPDTPLVESLPFIVPAATGDLLAEARRLYEQGDYGRAVLYLFAHQLVQLDRHQVIQLAKGKTNRQYLREVGTRRALSPLVERTMIAFEEVFFGGHTIDRARFESCWADQVTFEDLVVQEAAL
jgi:hypothetical protein